MRTTCYVSILFLLSALFTACSDDQGDTTKPVIQLISPEEGAVLKPGSHMHLEMELSDDVMLGSYKVEIHSNSNGHTHTKAEETTPFAYTNSWDISGKKNELVHHHEIEIPANATEGNYHLMVYCTDAAGNQSYVARSIVLDEHGETGAH